MYSNTEGIINTALGFQALYNNTEGNFNTAVGHKSMQYNSVGKSNIAFGHYSLRSNTTGSANIAIGVRALFSTIDRSNLVALGDSALFNNGIGASELDHAKGNTALGSKSLFLTTTGNSNTAVGNQSLESNTTGDHNTAIGYNADVAESNLTNATAIGANAVVNQSNSMVLGNNVNVGIGTSSPDESALLELNTTTKGFLPPRMSISERESIISPAAGLFVYQTTEPPGYYYFNGSNWISITDAGTGAISNSACIDYDGNAYPTFTIGSQVWMAENLRVTHYSNGDANLNETDAGAWETLLSGAYCWYDNDQVTNGYYGTLYNWYAVDDSRSLCPDGWHIPSLTEWNSLTTYLGGIDVSGGKMKSNSDLWDSPNTDATNISNFSGLPGGYLSSGTFHNVNYTGVWWSATLNSSEYPWILNLGGYYSYIVVNNAAKYNGYSVRCLRD